MSTYCRPNALPGTVKAITIVLVLFASSFFPPLTAQTETPDTKKPVIYLDPGHGGEDTGVQGSNGLLEKDFTLALAKKISRVSGNHTVVRLSRNEDYSLSLYSRTESANSRDADLFVSLHVGGAFNYSQEGIRIFYYQDTPGRILPKDDDSDARERTAWHNVPYRHATESRRLARTLQTRLSPLSGSGGCQQTGAPLLVLSGADMPSVLIEIGNLSNPGDEPLLASGDYLETLAQAICSGIDDFLTKPPDITSIDLHE